MKLAIDILQAKRNALYKCVQEQTLNVNCYQHEVLRARERIAYYEKEARAKEASASRACVKRNEFQAQLNIIDSAIVKLTS